jgi:hypothetical protein
VLQLLAVGEALLPGADFMKPFRPKFADKNLIGPVQDFGYELTRL